MLQWHEADMYNRMYLNLEGGKKCAMPRYYKDKIYTKEQREHIGGYLAGKMADELAEVIANYPGDYYRDKAEADIAAFRRKEFLSSKGETL